jgi:hypothetical protein
MSTLFEVPCPHCGRLMCLSANGEDVECATCGLAYRARMGHLFPVGDRPPLPDHAAPPRYGD